MYVQSGIGRLIRIWHTLTNLKSLVIREMDKHRTEFIYTRK
jgi:hypothetical protein